MSDEITQLQPHLTLIEEREREQEVFGGDDDASPKKKPRPAYKDEHRPSYGTTRLCVPCRTAARAEQVHPKTWKCRRCKLVSCVHNCTDKDVKDATCWPCIRAGATRKTAIR